MSPEERRQLIRAAIEGHQTEGYKVEGVDLLTNQIYSYLDHAQRRELLNPAPIERNHEPPIDGALEAHAAANGKP